jgi:hypothetical protein
MNESSWNSHGFDTSGVGNRHFEIYGNSFFYKDSSVNQNWQIWIRGGTGVVYDNAIDDITGQTWGDKPEITLSVRAASDGGGQYPGGCCTTWPCIRQVGQNHDGTSQYLDPIRFWNNSGSFRITANQAWGTCGGPASEFIQSGRDYVSTDARPGYKAYPYPHPLRLGEPPRPLPPTDLVLN